MSVGFDDSQAVAQVRAANFYALQAFWKSPKRLNQIWDDLVAQGVDVSRPLGYYAAAALGRLDITGDVLREHVEAVFRSFGNLEPDDRILEWRAVGYPGLLSQIPDAPRFLFARMQEPIFDAPALAIVGTRHPSEEGWRRAHRLAYLLAKRGITVVSGLARGVDAAAHRGALDVGGKTIAVIGTPLNRAYPKEHTPLQAHVARVGALVSQFSPSSNTTPLCFPLRNATMSGLCLGTVIVEASESSGALIQAQHCLAHGRKLFIPKSAVDNPGITWPRKHLEKGAIMFSEVDELLDVLAREGLLPTPVTAEVTAAEILRLNVVGG